MVVLGRGAVSDERGTPVLSPPVSRNANRWSRARAFEIGINP